MILNVKHYRDPEGNQLANVPLTNSDKQVILYEDDLKSLVDKDIPLTWKLTSLNQVVVCGKRHKEKDNSVARLIMDAGRKDRLKLKDKDPCNLRRENILVTSSKEIGLGDVVINHIFE